MAGGIFSFEQRRGVPVTRDQAIAALAHWYAATWTAPTAPDVLDWHTMPAPLKAYLDSLDGRESPDVAKEAHAWAKSIVADFQRSHLRVAARLAEQAPQPADTLPRQTWQTGALE